MPLERHDKVPHPPGTGPNVQVVQSTQKGDQAKGAKASPEEEQEIAHMIPIESVLLSLRELKPDKFYLIVYLRIKTDEECHKEQQVSN